MWLWGSVNGEMGRCCFECTFNSNKGQQAKITVFQNEHQEIRFRMIFRIRFMFAHDMQSFIIVKSILNEVFFFY